MEKIICGFAGVGKSTLAKSKAGFVDLESTPFDKDWERYIKVAKHMADNGYVVLLSCHKELRKTLLEKGIKFTTIIPAPILEGMDSKTVYLKRYRERGNDENFVNLMSNNWGEFNTKIDGEQVFSLALDEFLTDIF